ncbi:YmL10 [Dinochytrium kinnereticum]|nr:YmL10 [Dinochytrium kinnereticum]
MKRQRRQLLPTPSSRGILPSSTSSSSTATVYKRPITLRDLNSIDITAEPSDTRRSLTDISSALLNSNAASGKASLPLKRKDDVEDVEDDDDEDDGDLALFGGLGINAASSSRHSDPMTERRISLLIEKWDGGTNEVRTDALQTGSMDGDLGRQIDVIAEMSSPNRQYTKPLHAIIHSDAGITAKEVEPDANVFLDPIAVSPSQKREAFHSIIVVPSTQDENRHLISSPRLAIPDTPFNAQSKTLSAARENISFSTTSKTRAPALVVSTGFDMDDDEDDEDLITPHPEQLQTTATLNPASDSSNTTNTTVIASPSFSHKTPLNNTAVKRRHRTVPDSSSAASSHTFSSSKTLIASESHWPSVSKTFKWSNKEVSTGLDTNHNTFVTPKPTGRQRRMGTSGSSLVGRWPDGLLKSRIKDQRAQNRPLHSALTFLPTNILTEFSVTKGLTDNSTLNWNDPIKDSQDESFQNQYLNTEGANSELCVSIAKLLENVVPKSDFKVLSIAKGEGAMIALEHESSFSVIEYSFLGEITERDRVGIGVRSVIPKRRAGKRATMALISTTPPGLIVSGPGIWGVSNEGFLADAKAEYCAHIFSLDSNDKKKDNFPSEMIWEGQTQEIERKIYNAKLLLSLPCPAGSHIDWEENGKDTLLVPPLVNSSRNMIVSLDTTGKPVSFTCSDSWSAITHFVRLMIPSETVNQPVTSLSWVSFDSSFLTGTVGTNACVWDVTSGQLLSTLDITIHLPRPICIYSMKKMALPKKSELAPDYSPNNLKTGTEGSYLLNSQTKNGPVSPTKTFDSSQRADTVENALSARLYPENSLRKSEETTPFILLWICSATKDSVDLDDGSPRVSVICLAVKTVEANDTIDPPAHATPIVTTYGGVGGRPIAPLFMALDTIEEANSPTDIRSADEEETPRPHSLKRSHDLVRSRSLSPSTRFVSIPALGALDSLESLTAPVLRRSGQSQPTQPVISNRFLMILSQPQADGMAQYPIQCAIEVYDMVTRRALDSIKLFPLGVGCTNNDALKEEVFAVGDDTYGDMDAIPRLAATSALDNQSIIIGAIESQGLLVAVRGGMCMHTIRINGHAPLITTKILQAIRKGGDGKRKASISITKLVREPREYVHAGNLKDNDGARKKKRRVGRGLGSGLGKTSGRGQKGWKARASRARPTPGYEGGQTGLLKAIPKLGFRSRDKLRLSRIHLDTIQHWVDSGRLDASKPITIKSLVDSGCIGTVKDGVVLLAKGGHFLRQALTFELTHASQLAIKMVEAKGGKITCFDYDRKTIRALLKPERYLSPPNPSPPTGKNIPMRYFDVNRRGYLSDKIHLIMASTQPKVESVSKA